MSIVDGIQNEGKHYRIVSCKEKHDERGEGMLCRKKHDSLQREV
jgi:hypothetical protein